MLLMLERAGQIARPPVSYQTVTLAAIELR
jgi:hypothetical protein